MAFNIKHFIILTVFFITSFSLPHQALSVEDQLEPGQSKTANISSNQNTQDLNAPAKHKEMPKPARGKISQLEPWTHETLLDKSAILLPSILIGGRFLMMSAQNLTLFELGSGIALGIFGADLASGIVHAIGDFISDDEPQEKPSPLTKLHMKLFRSAYGHHENPRHLVKMSYWEKTRGFNILLIPVLGVATVWGGWGGYTLTVGGMFLANSEVFHSMAHSAYSGENRIVIPV
ncbi:hypothetical protein [Candidatus Finniella inopinata]|uniref:Lipid desaturase domain-containing protein n=1 Tax=Candidatus Finniella inopinata TaxID=1696036 RepID=A0A4Q7DKT5_9PROT|nr:hypothetical protein [Candidatus Finniella inopinata]RZI47008.1 hypothetical protein EQU50_00005 [Candidatus Finniella inopinata]